MCVLALGGLLMKNVAIRVAAITGLLGTPALAADLAVKAPPRPAPAYNWTGIYVGGNVGGAWSTTDWTFFNAANSEAFSQDASSWIGGGQIGYRYQFAPNWVGAIEASWSGTDLKNTSLSVLNADRSRQSQITDLLLVTGSLGYALNNWLTYVKGGYANANVGFNTFVASTGQVTTTSSSSEGGWTVGAGIEYGFTPNISGGIEYDFARINIGNRNQTVAPAFIAPETVSTAQADIQTLLARVNFRFAGWQ
jgi:outer membrane immunogenic protein